PGQAPPRVSRGAGTSDPAGQPAKADPLGAAPRLAAFHQLTPALDVDLDAEFFRRRLDPPPGGLPFGGAHALDLVEAGDRVAHVTGVAERLLASLRKGKSLRGHPVLLLGTEPGRFLRNPRAARPGALHRAGA